MPVSDLEHFKALREADQRAVELLAAANAAKTTMVISMMISAVSVLVAIGTVVFHH